jgi:dTDP-4-amino-4,6-dideoxygalactose transaminase/glycosyltransferase involved in cell wall biosynthesis
VGCPTTGNREALLRRINDLLDRRWLANNGPYAQELERRVAAFIGVRHCVLTSSGTTGLELAIRASGMTGEVIVPAFTFVATAHALRWLGLTPVFCDIDRRTHNIDPSRLEALITPRTSGIIGVHLWGRACDVEALVDIADRHDLRLLFDAAHAFACSHRGRLVGGFGLAEVFSFHATKFFNTFEGGAVTCADDDLAARLRLLRNFGFAAPDTVVTVGTNAKMSEVAAAMGLTQLEELDALIARNRRNYHLYRDLLRGLPGVTLVPYDETARNNYQYIVLEVDEASTGIGAAELVAALQAENVFARRYFHPGCHRMEPYRSRPGAAWRLPETDRLAARVVCLPTGEVIGAAEIGAICQIIRLAAGEGSTLRARLADRADAGPRRDTACLGDERVRVSVLIEAYNHEPFIAQAVESAVQQRTDFPIEIVIGEDCSTDGTRAVLLGLRDRYPDKIRLLLRKRNLGNIGNLTDALSACRGEYVALLDGDDFWTSPDKLQRQVAFLDAHPAFSSCAHDAVVVDEAGRPVAGADRRRLFSRVITLRRMLISDPVRTCTVMFRRGLFGAFPEWYSTALLGDWPLHVLNLMHGAMWYDRRTAAAYRMHGGGLWSGAVPVSRRMARIEIYRHFNEELGFAYDGLIRRRIARQYLALAEHYARAGDVARTRDNLRQAVRTCHWDPRVLSHRSCLRLLPVLTHRT